MANDYDALAKRIRRKVYASTEELANDFADGLSAIARQPSTDRGIQDQTIADVQGGTTMGVGDPAASHVSDYLVQNPQMGEPRDTGSGLRTRRQTRIRTDTRVLAAKVVESAVAGATEVEVIIVGATPVKGTDAVTGMDIVADASGGLQDSVADMIGKQMAAKVTGQPIVAAGATGIQPIDAGTTVSVAVNTQYEDTTTWTKRGRKNLPVVVSVKKCETACLVNGLACAGTVCVPVNDEFHGFVETADPLDGQDWTYSAGNVYEVGRPWIVIQLGNLYPSGALVLGVDVFAYDSGTIPVGGLVPFAGIPYSVPLGSGEFYDPISKPPGYMAYGYYVIIGCTNDDGNNYGTLTFGGPQGDPTQDRTWTLTDY